jgi:protein-tyrosine phosphatase
MADSRGTTYYDEAAHQLFKELGLDRLSGAPGAGGLRAGCIYNPLDPIIKVGDGAIYVGNEQAARSRSMLDSANITHVVNCTDNIPNFHEASPRPLRYLRFPISFWPQHVDASHASVLAFAQQLFDFIDAALSKGGSVLIHCLAGAHRAGTVGVTCLMRQHRLNPADATAVAKRLRPAINPIGMLPEFLRRYHLAVQHLPNGLPQGAPPSAASSRGSFSGIFKKTALGRR